MQQKHILISGGGIAGCTLAYFLRQHGFQPVVVDAAQAYKRAGYLLALNEQIGQKVAQNMGVLDRLREFEVPLMDNVMYDTSGRQLVRFTLDQKALNQRVGLMINRADLQLTLYELVKHEVDFRMNTAIVAMNETGNGVDVTFADGRQETFDAVIGADGIHSTVRKLTFGAGLEKYMGYAYFAFATANAPVARSIAESEARVIRADGFALAYHRLSRDEIGGYAFYKEQSLAAVPPADRRNALLKEYGRYDATFKAILEGMEEDAAIFHDGFIQIVMPSWHKGRVCLIGDAASCPTPASGVGAAMAMAAAYIVAKNLSASDYQGAFAEYDRYMRPYINKAQSSAARMLVMAAGGNFISYEFTNFLLRLIPGGLLGRLHSHAIDMPLP